MVVAETVHGTVRTLLFAPRIGDGQARQVSVVTGSLLIIGIAYLFIRWVRAGAGGGASMATAPASCSHRMHFIRHPLSHWGAGLG
jgi:hypothetical protein